MLRALFLALCAITSSARRPNVIFMILDDMDSMLNATSVMPHYLQRFRDEGLFFKNAFVASPKCCPSRTSLLAGRFSHNLNDTAQGWCGNFITAGTWNRTWLANVKAAGYATGFFGKMVNEMGGAFSPRSAAVAHRASPRPPYPPPRVLRTGLPPPPPNPNSHVRPARAGARGL